MTPLPQASFLWHDYETFGADPRRDRPAEFACWRTDENFEPIADPVVLRCKPTLDYLPQPEACAITGIGPEAAWRDGLNEPAFALRVRAEMIEPQGCVLGYNSMRFDDEVTRHLFWRNFIDPYEREWANGNSRFDLIDLARAAYALRPQGLEWPLRGDGHPSFRLGDLAQANALPHSRAHSALSDVEATLALGRRLRAAQPRLFEHALAMRSKRRVLEMLDWRRRHPVLHVSQRYAAERGCLAMVVPVAPHPVQDGKIIVVDASVDPANLFAESPERLAELLVQPASAGERIPLGLKLVHANRAPFLAPLSVLRGVDLARIKLDRERTDARMLRVQAAEGLDCKLQQVYRLLDAAPRNDQSDVDAALYEGFIGDADRALGWRFLKSRVDERGQLAERFVDARLRTLAQYFRGRHDEDALDAVERRLWIEHCRHRLQRPGSGLSEYETGIETLTATSPELADELRRWGERVRAHAGI
ncbi:MAG: exodeoxyribonuclease I [Xanthomonadales bacterium PRO6]|nr:Exodeoxyribonuclease I [Xanthomonadales bacterium]MCE7932114.1 exodeoxyribonuclease I [Xanthomonadales bacterium PRO6]